MSSLTQGIPTLAGKLTFQEHLAWKREKYEREKVLWAAHLALLSSTDLAIAVQHKTDLLYPKNPGRLIATSTRDKGGDIRLHGCSPTRGSRLRASCWKHRFSGRPRTRRHAGCCGRGARMGLARVQRMIDGKLIHPIGAAKFVKDIAVVTGTPHGTIDTSLLKTYDPNNQMLWFADHKGFAQGWAKKAKAALLRGALLFYSAEDTATPRTRVHSTRRSGAHSLVIINRTPSKYYKF
jgi:hypothetical protein